MTDPITIIGFFMDAARQMKEEVEKNGDVLKYQGQLEYMTRCIAVGKQALENECKD